MTNDFDNQSLIDTDDRRAFVSAAAAVARLDEALLRTGHMRPLFMSSMLRREAAAMASMEGTPARIESIARLLADPDATMMERGARLAADLHKALGQATEWPASGPDSSALSRAFATSDASTSRLIRPDMAWSLEDDCEQVAEDIARLVETPEPWNAVETMRRIWTSGRFLGHSRRMAILAAPMLLSIGFGCYIPLLGMAEQVRKNPDRFRDAASNQDDWALVVAGALSQAAREGRTRLVDLEALRMGMATLCPSERSSSSVGAAIDLLIASPIVTAKTLGSALDITPRGAKVILDKLTEAGILEVEGGTRNRSFVCRRTL